VKASNENLKNLGDEEEMRSTTPLAPWLKLYKPLLLILLLLTTACGSKQNMTHQTLASDQGSEYTNLASFAPSSPFMRLAPNHYTNPTIDLNKVASNNPFYKAHSTGPFNNRLIALAYSQIGTMYHAGGIEPGTGFDCSGFTSWVFNKLGVNLPRSSREQFQEGKIIAKSQLRKGDLVFFGTKKRITHVGIYLEDNKFIHSSSSGDTVKISSLDDPTWERRYTGARRIF
jgi:cell wall-associated NlpC family hydrolase